MKPGPKPKRVSVEWSETLAYGIGLIATDGNLSKSGRHIELTSKDRDQLTTFLGCIGRPDVKITHKSGMYRKRITRVQFGDVVLYQFLLSIGLTQNKSKTLSRIKVPRAYFADFVRGVFDGDGSSYSYYDPLFPKSFRFYISFASASPFFLPWLQESLHRYTNIRGSIQKSLNRDFYQLKYSKREALILAGYLYPSTSVPHLRRKYLKIRRSVSIIERSRSGEIGKHATFRS